jgi:glycosyltransferase involved in cell wall biosynthesis
MIELARNYEVGLAVEQPEPLNRQLCLTNKAFTYMLAGLAIVFTDTLGQRELALDLAEGALLYRSGDTEALAAGLKRWATDKAALATARRAAWERARQRWHWEHEQERGALLKTVGAALTKGNAHRCHS